MSGSRKQRRRNKANEIDIDLNRMGEAVDAAQKRILTKEEHKLLRDAHRALEILAQQEPNNERQDELLKDQTPKQPPKPRKGSGRRGRDSFNDAETESVPHQAHKAGEVCKCGCGKLYPLNRPKYHRSFTGQPSIKLRIYELQQLRCNSCGCVYTADLPAGVSEETYDASAKTVFGIAKYSLGIPIYRQAQQYAAMGIPIAASVIYTALASAVPCFEPIVEHLRGLAANGELSWFDDTHMPILNFTRDPNDSRTGLFTTGIVSKIGDYLIAMLFTGRDHAGENRANLLKKRAPNLPGMIQMSDALAANFAYISVDEIIALCLTHGRRNFVKILDKFPEESRHVIESIGLVYHHDSESKQLGHNAEQRLAYHQLHSKPVMDALKTWLDAQAQNSTAEPNNPLGKAIEYLRHHWGPLTLFLRVAGAPLDSNMVERLLKKVVLHRKNSLFYKTAEGARVGDIYMTLIETCKLNGINPYDYLIALQHNREAAKASPGHWLPWTYKSTMAQAQPPPTQLAA